jgi:hypothetical protein
MTAIKVRNLNIGGVWVTCPGQTRPPRELTLIPSGAVVNATCGAMHRNAKGERGSAAQCFFPVENLTPAQLGTIGQAQPGKPFRLRVKGKGGAESTIEGKLVQTGGAVPSTAARAAAAANAKAGTPAAAGPAKPAGRATGGAMTAAFGALAAVAGAVGTTAAAAGQVATAGASAVGSVADLGREGIGLARDGVREAGAYGERRHERKMHGAGSGGDEG